MRFSSLRKDTAVKNGFTLIELLVVIAVVGVIAGAIIAIINPSKQFARARDAKRKTDIAQIAKAIESHIILRGNSPGETWCDSSIGTTGATDCPLVPAESGWSTGSGIYVGLVGGGYLKVLPIDPVNDTTYFYRYEPNTTSDYWIGGMLEDPPSPSQIIFRCATTNASTSGCRYVSGWLN